MAKLKAAVEFVIGSFIGTFSIASIIYINQLPDVLEPIRTPIGILAGLVLFGVMGLFFVHSGEVSKNWLRDKPNWKLIFLAALSLLLGFITSILFVLIPITVGNQPTTPLQMFSILIYGPILMGTVAFMQIAYQSLVMSE